MISDLSYGCDAKGIYLVTNVMKGVAKSGGNFLTVVLQDRSGTIEGKKWDATDNDYNTFVPGRVVNIEGSVGRYMEKLQISIDRGFNVDINVVNIDDIVLPSPIPVEELEKQLDFYIDSIKDKELSEIVKYVIGNNRKKYVSFPAAVRVHHEFFHGLLFHSVSMCNLAEAAAKNYPEVNRDLLISGCILHDIGKIVEFTGPVACKYTLEGDLLGHLVIGENIIKEAAETLKITGETPLLLEHMVASHHGKLEFGACVLPKTREALLLSMIDEMDAKMMSLNKALAVTENGTMTDRLFAFDNRSFYKPNK